MYSTDPREKEDVSSLMLVAQCLPSLNLTPFRTTHIHQELWRYKKAKAFSLTPTEAMLYVMVYHDDLDNHHIVWLYTINKRGRAA
jgi:hypothetical protein